MHIVFLTLWPQSVRRRSSTAGLGVAVVLGACVCFCVFLCVCVCFCVCAFHSVVAQIQQVKRSVFQACRINYVVTQTLACLFCAIFFFSFFHSYNHASNSLKSFCKYEHRNLGCESYVIYSCFIAKWSHCYCIVLCLVQINYVILYFMFYVRPVFFQLQLLMRYTSMTATKQGRECQVWWSGLCTAKRERDRVCVCVVCVKAGSYLCV